jgi:phosphate:Na+ symporter
LSWYNVISAAAGLGLFLFGLRLMSRSLARSAGPALQKLLHKLVGTPAKGFVAGALVTAALQSSSLTSVMVVGLVNARLLNLAQGMGVIIGANVGTTVTAQLLSFELHRLALPVIALSVLFCLARRPSIRKPAASLLGFGLLLLGLNGMSGALAALAGSNMVTAALRAAGEAPWLGVGAGFFAAALLQSSSAVMGLVIGMALEGAIGLPAAVAVLIGADLGTCTTALVASVGMNRAACAAALSHFLFNLASLLLAAPFFPYLVLLASKTALTLPRQVANAHTLYNLLGALVLLPLIPVLARLMERTPSSGMKIL